MNSLQELNGYGNTSVNYTDNRDPGIRFDRVNTTNQTKTINQHDTHGVPTGIEIVEVIRAVDCTPTYTINVSTITGATVSWATVPTGCTVTNPSTGVYTISGVNSKAIWNIVKSPTITLAAVYVGTGSYTATITYNSTETKSWTTALTVIDITNMDTADDFYFLGGVAGTITGNPQVIDNYPTTWNVTVTPSSTTLITSMTTAGSGGTSSFNATTKVLSISGTKTQVNSHLNSISYVIPSTTKQDFTLEYVADNVALSEGDSKTQQLYTTEYLSATRASETYQTNTTTTISNGPLITDATYTGTGLYTMTITPSTTSAVSTMGSSLAVEYWPTYTLSTSFAAGDAQSNYGISANAGLTYISYSNVTSNEVKVYTRTGTSLGLQQTLTPSGYPSQSGNPLKFGTTIKTNTNFDVMAVVAQGDNLPAESAVVEHGAVYIFRRSGTSWSQELRAINSNTDANYYYQHVDLSPDGNTFVTAPGTSLVNGNKMDFYNYRTGNWYLDSTITIPEQREILGFSNDNTYFFLASPYTAASGISGAGSIYVYKRTGDTWAQDTIIYPNNPILNGNFGGVGSRKMPNGTFAFGQSDNTTEIYTFSAGSWTRTSTLNYSVPSKNYSMSATNTYYVAEDTVYKLTASGYTKLVYIGDNSLVETASSGNYYSIISSDGNYILQMNVISSGSTPSMYVYTSGDPNRISFNNTTKVLTLTETKANLNTTIDTITFTPATGYTSNFTLTYSVTTPTTATDSRDQSVNHTS
jgi:hypothetical protein